MHSTHIAIIASVVAVSGTVANADIVRVDEFRSDQTESFEQLRMDVFHHGDVESFGGMGTLFSVGESGYLHTTGSWSFHQRVAAFDGERLLGSNAGIGYRFNEAQRSFGGFFSSITSDADGEIRFYSGEDLIGTDTLDAPIDTSWAWNGWSSDQEFDRVEIESSYISKGYLLHDAIRVLSSAVPAPGGAVLAFGGLLVIARRKR
tara:strand:- start:8041 stop:8652 length:612 start_codon:yes stop_codon:yes gene_type:complete